MDLIMPNSDVTKSKGGIILPEPSKIILPETPVPPEFTPQPIPQKFAGLDIPILGEAG